MQHKNVDHVSGLWNRGTGKCRGDQFVVYSAEDVRSAGSSMRITGRKKEMLVADRLHEDFKALAKQKKVDYGDFFVV